MRPTDFVVREYNGAWAVFRREDVNTPIEHGLTLAEALATDFDFDQSTDAITFDF